MNGHTHSLAEWAAFLSLGLAVWAVEAAVIWLIADAESLDPRRPVARVLDSGRLDPLLILVGPLLAAARESVRDAAALLILLTTTPKGALR